MMTILLITHKVVQGWIIQAPQRNHSSTSTQPLTASIVGCGVLCCHTLNMDTYGVFQIQTQFAAISHRNYCRMVTRLDWLATV